MKEYLPRIYDQILEDQLEAAGAVLVEGPKWCGKTTTCEQHANSAVYLQDTSHQEENLVRASLDPSHFLAGDTPMLVDEWQMVPTLWDAARFEVDRRGESGQFIFTGSAVPADMTEVKHTGTGRFARVRMRPMSLLESGDSTGEVSLTTLFEGGKQVDGANSCTIELLASFICRGGWPSSIGKSENAALRQARNYFDSIVNSDISRVDDVKRSPELARAILKSYARMAASQGALSNIATDVSSNGTSVSEKTVRDYLAAFEKIFVIEEMPAWNPNLRSKTAIRTAATRHFVDPSIAAVALGAGPGGLVADLKTLGLLFESLVVRDLRIYADALEGSVSHFRDKYGLECDAVMHLWDGRYGLIEVKLGGKELIDEGAASLTKLASKIDTNKMNEPSFLMVVTGVGEHCYRREDGVYVVPITTLGV